MEKRELAIQALVLAITAPTLKKAETCHRMATEFCYGMTNAEVKSIQRETIKRLNEVKYEN